MRKFAIRSFISILLCLVIIISASANVKADEAADKKIVKILAKYIGEKDENGNVLAGKALNKERDFEFKIQYKGDKKEYDLPKEELSYIKISPETVPIDGKSGFVVTVTYDNTAKTDNGKPLVYKMPAIPMTNEYFYRMEARWNGPSQYHVGDEIKKKEINVTVVNKVKQPSGQETEVTRTILDFTISPSVIMADGENDVKVIYKGRETIVKIKAAGAKELEVTYSGDKNIVVGNSVDTNKIKANIVYSNNDKKAVNNKELSFENLEVKATGEHTVLVKYGNLIGKLVLNGIAKVPDKLTAKYTGLDLVVGTKIDPSKITVEITNNDKSKESITTGFTISPETVTAIGSNTITVTYKGYTTTVVIKGTELLPNNLTATYNGGAVIEGSTIDKANILVTAYYPNGTNKTVSDFELSVETMNKVGLQDVIVKYKNLTSTIYVPVTAKMVTQLEAVYNGGALEQFESIDRKKLIVTATYNDGSRTNVDDYTINSTTANQVGENVFTVNFGGKTVTFTVEALARRITGMGTLTAEVSGEDYSSTLTAFIQDQVVREGIKLETEEIEADIIKPAIKRVNNASTKKYIAFDMNVDNFQFDENQYMTTEFTVPEGFDPAKVAIFFTPDRRKTMIQLTGGLVASNLYRFYVYESGSYVIMENNNNDITLQEMRDNERRKPFMVVSIDRKLPVKTKSKIKPYVLFSAYKDEEFTFEVDDEDLMTISKTGEMTTKAAGTVNVTVSAKNSKLSETYEVNIKGNAE